jgi:hypothetical protein
VHGKRQYIEETVHGKRQYIEYSAHLDARLAGGRPIDHGHLVTKHNVAFPVSNKLALQLCPPPFLLTPSGTGFYLDARLAGGSPIDHGHLVTKQLLLCITWVVQGQAGAAPLQLSRRPALLLLLLPRLTQLIQGVLVLQGVGVGCVWGCVWVRVGVGGGE